MTIEVTKGHVPVSFRLDCGNTSDSKILDKLLSTNKKLPYELYLDKGYERYHRRRELKKKNCQVRMEMKKAKSRKDHGFNLQINKKSNVVRLKRIMAG